MLSSSKHSGHIDLPPEKDLDFRINEATVGLTGEEVETLALVLADIASMLWTVQGNGHHPCFLLHDSPREADLDGFIYGRYFRGLHKLSKELGDSDAPFQYIVTTTSKPPESLIQDDTVRLTLKTDGEQEMLFRTILRRANLLGVQDEKENANEGK